MRRFILVCLLLFLCGVVVALLIPDIRWRLQAIGLHATGQIEDVSFRQLLTFLVPNSGYYLKPIVENHSVHQSVINPFMSDEDIRSGERLYASGCVTCHGSAGLGGTAPALATYTFKHGVSDWSIFRSIDLGIDGTAMPAHNYSERDTWNLVAYLRSLQNPVGSEQTESASLDVRPVTSERLLAANAEPENWLAYSSTYNGYRHSGLTQINRDNAAQVAVSWMHQFAGEERIVESSPIVLDGIMYVTEPPNIVHALDARTGESIWTYRHTLPPDVRVCCGLVNRGVAVTGDTLLLGTLDALLIALDARTGTERWRVKSGEYQGGLSFTSPPLVVGNLAILGPGGADLGARGYIDAYDVSDGTLVWRRYTVPAPGEPGSESWEGDSWERGGGTGWMPGVYDPELDILYWGTGNPSPNYQGELRKGDNLYTDSVLALDPKTGDVRWHFQFTPHDEHDWAANQVPSLVDLEYEGRMRKTIMWANRNGFFYLLDRETGEFLLAKAFVKQNWAASITASGRPILNEATVLDQTGKITWPSPIGGTSWWSPSYSPRTKLFYVPALEFGQVVFKDVKPVTYTPGEYYLGGGQRPIPGAESLYFSVRAIDPSTGEIVWRYDNPTRPSWWKTGGLVSTAGDIVFGGDGTDFYILDAANGEELWRMNVGGRINAVPISYAVEGKQMLALAAGRSIVVLSLP